MAARGAVFALACLVALIAVVSARDARLSPLMREALARHEEARALDTQPPLVSFLVVFSTRADLSAIRAAPHDPLHPHMKGEQVKAALEAVAHVAQAPVLAFLEQSELRVEVVRPYWIANFVKVRAEAAVAEALLAAFPHRIKRIEVDAPFTVTPPTAHGEPVPVAELSIRGDRLVEWNVQWIGADRVWDLGVNGTGIVVASADSGVQWSHPALVNSFRGRQLDDTMDFSYSWWDAVHETGSTCGASSPEPCDDLGHGTHTVGTMVGFDGIQYVGVAPGAQWIGCRNMNANHGTPSLYMECMEFFMAPWDSNGMNPDVSKRPHIINNSWGCGAEEGCSADTLEDAVNAVIASGIVFTVAAGNSGPGCSTILSPPSFYSECITVAAQKHESSTVASFSSRGPVTVFETTQKPEVSAPGQSVRSSVPVSQYQYYSGTSMATPAVSGTIALMMEANPSLQFDPETVKSLLIETTTELHDDSTCSAPGVVPNNAYGFGAIDAFRVVSYILDPLSNYGAKK